MNPKRRTFAATFFLACLAAIELEGVALTIGAYDNLQFVVCFQLNYDAGWKAIEYRLADSSIF